MTTLINAYSQFVSRVLINAISKANNRQHEGSSVMYRTMWRLSRSLDNMDEEVEVSESTRNLLLTTLKALISNPNKNIFPVAICQQLICEWFPSSYTF